MHKVTTRTRHRKRAVDTLFEAQQRGFGEDPQRIRELAAERTVLSAAQTPLPPFAQTLVNGVADNLSQIDSLIATYSRDWDLDRLAGTDLAAMRVAVWEMLANDEVDPRVAIDQAVTIVAMIGTDQSPSFVNAVLDRIRKVIAADKIRAKNASTFALQPDSSESSWESYLEQALTASAAPIATEEATANAATPEEAEPADSEAAAPAAASADADAPAEPDSPSDIAADKPELAERYSIPDWLLADLRDDYEEE